jgi:dCTP deaminase
MTLLNADQIAKLAENDILLPFIGEKRRTLDNGTKAISYGLSQSGYDIRLSSTEFLVYNSNLTLENSFNGPLIDPKNYNGNFFNAPLVEEENGSCYFVLPAHTFALGTSLELISMPNDVFAICQGKSTYGRCGLIANILPIEPGWTGYLTMCLVNPTETAIRLYVNEGIAQLIFFSIDETKPYEGIYQNQSARVQLAAI